MVVAMATLLFACLQALTYTIVLHILMWLTGLQIEIESFWGAFIVVSAVTIILPVIYLIDICLSVLYEFIFKKNTTFFVGLKKVVEILILTFIINQIDAFSGSVQLSLNAEAVFAFIIFIIFECFIKRSRGDESY
ncbi:hypothetical protein NDS46_30950 (plasmid) [Paenibacillus thiaminolyticus]|uniref:hypothetical protein n=1 Tax=Paenibacillus thiaminolyticus TaxID=49283 RepID=UPI0023301294|nr:hypothetical protein [Paenibacillus thiaminolyticus]WCF11379.1 hypothetical protein NDS46_30950 [Paenibacillus thiaminolyticus]